MQAAIRARQQRQAIAQRRRINELEALVRTRQAQARRLRQASARPTSNAQAQRLARELEERNREMERLSAELQASRRVKPARPPPPRPIAPKPQFLPQRPIAPKPKFPPKFSPQRPTGPKPQYSQLLYQDLYPGRTLMPEYTDISPRFIRKSRPSLPPKIPTASSTRPPTGTVYSKLGQNRPSSSQYSRLDPNLSRNIKPGTQMSFTNPLYERAQQSPYAPITPRPVPRPRFTPIIPQQPNQQPPSRPSSPYAAPITPRPAYQQVPRFQAPSVSGVPNPMYQYLGKMALQNQNKQLKKRVEQLAQRLKEPVDNDIITALQAELALAKKQLEQLKTTPGESNVTELLAKIAGLEVELKKGDMTKEHLQKANSILTDYLSVMEVDMAGLKHRLTASQQRRLNREQEFKREKNDLSEDYKTRLSELNDTFNRYNEQNKDYKAKLEQTQKTLLELNAMKKTLQNRPQPVIQPFVDPAAKAQAQAQSARMKKTIEDLENKIVEITKDKMGLEANNHTLTRGKESVEQELKTVKQAMSQLQKTSTSDLDKSQTRVDNLTKELKRLGAMNSKLNQKLDAAKEDRNDFESIMEGHYKNVQQLEKTIGILKSRIPRQQTQSQAQSQI